MSTNHTAGGAPSEPVAYWNPKGEQFCLAPKDGTRPFAKVWEPLYAAPQPTVAEHALSDFLDELMLNSAEKARVFQLAALSQSTPAPAPDASDAIVPARYVSEENRGHETQTYGLGYKSGWNDCRERVKEALANAPVAPAPAQGLSDAERYQWIRGPSVESTRYSRWRIEYWDGPNGWQPMQRERMDAAIDAAILTANRAAPGREG